MQHVAGRALVAGLTLVVPVAATMLLLGGRTLPAAAAPASPYATSTAVALHLKDIASIGMTGYDGTWGMTATGPAGGRNQSDFTDNSGMENYISVATKNSQTSGINAPLVYDARADLNTLFTGPSLISGGPKIISLATLQNYVRCAPTAKAQASSFTVASTAFGKTLNPGTPLTVDVTGADLGLPKVKDGKVTVTLTNIKETDGDQTAAARTVITVSGDLNTTDGGTYSGELATMVLGDVRVNCGQGVEPTTAVDTTTPTESPTDTTSPTDSPTDTTSPTESPTDTTSPTPTTSASPTSSTSPSPARSPRPVPVPSHNGHPGLPVTGFDLQILGGMAGLLAVLGAAMLTAARRPRDSRA
jgi:hypothetical protein